MGNRPVVKCSGVILMSRTIKREDLYVLAAEVLALLDIQTAGSPGSWDF